MWRFVGHETVDSQLLYCGVFMSEQLERGEEGGGGRERRRETKKERERG